MAIEQADNIQTGAPKPTDSRYYNNLIPYASTGETNSIIDSGVRYTGLTVNILGTEYWYKEGITDPDLVIKEAGGGTLNMSGDTANGLTTYVDATTICAQSGITFNNGVFTIKNGAASGCVLQSDASGNATWETPSGGGTVTGATNGLTLSGADVILGGELTGNTNIGIGTHYLNICNGSVTTYGCTNGNVNEILLQSDGKVAVSYTHLTLPTTPYV